MHGEFLQTVKRPNIRSNEERLKRTGLALEYFKDFEQEQHDYHSHDFIEILFVVNGSFRHITADLTYDETAGGLTILNYRQFHSLKTPNGPVELMNIYLNPDFYPFPGLPDPLASRLYELIPLHPGLGNRLNRIRHLNVKDPDRVSLILKMMLREQESEEQGSDAAIQSLFRLFLIELCRAAPVIQEDKTDSYILRMEKVRDYLEKNYTESVRLDELSSLSGLNHANLCRRFKEYAGMSTGDFLKQRRLAAALQQLRMTDDKILVIAEDCGFSDVSRFNRYFREAFGSTPSAYRDNVKADKTF